MNKFELSSPEVKTMVCDLLHQIEYEYSQEYKYELDENCKLSELLQKKQQELERYKNIIKNIKEEIELYIDITIDHLETSNEEINFELRNKCRAMREIKSEILEIIEKELKGE